MPMKESPSCNSVRVQKAYRLNNIEQARLQRQLVLLKRERMHAVRTNVQEKRRAQLMLDHIGAHSGHSPLGLAPQEKVKYVNTDENPTFMYGERQKSRRFGKFRRAQSAFEPGKKLGNVSEVESDAGSVTSSNRSQRPKTSPAKRAPAATPIGFDAVVLRAMSRSQSRNGSTHVNSDDDNDSIPDNMSSSSKGNNYHRRPSSTIPVRHEETPDGHMNNTITMRPKTSNAQMRRSGQNGVTKVAFNENNNKLGVDSERVPSRNGILRNSKQAFSEQNKKVENDEIENLTKSLRKTTIPTDEVDSPLTNIDYDNTKAYEPQNNTGRRKVGPKPHAKNAPIVQIVNKARLMSSAAKRWRNMATKGHSMKADDDGAAANWATKREKSQAKLDIAVSMHTQQRKNVNDRLEDFLQQYSAKKCYPERTSPDGNQTDGNTG